MDEAALREWCIPEGLIDFILQKDIKKCVAYRFNRICIEENMADKFENVPKNSEKFMNNKYYELIVKYIYKRKPKAYKESLFFSDNLNVKLDLIKPLGLKVRDIFNEILTDLGFKVNNYLKEIYVNESTLEFILLKESKNYSPYRQDEHEKELNEKY